MTSARYSTNTTYARGLVQGLRLVSDLGVIESEQVALLVGVKLDFGATIGDVAALGRRTRARHVRMHSDWEHVLAGDNASIPTAALGPAADEIAIELATRLLDRVRALR